LETEKIDKTLTLVTLQEGRVCMKHEINLVWLECGNVLIKDDM